MRNPNVYGRDDVNILKCIKVLQIKKNNKNVVSDGAHLLFQAMKNRSQNFFLCFIFITHCLLFPFQLFSVVSADDDDVLDVHVLFFMERLSHL